MRVTLKLPRFGMNMHEATLTEWFRQPGESFGEGDVLYAIETDKVAEEVPATFAGTVLEILVPPGQEIFVGDPLCVVNVEMSKPDGN